MSDFKGNSQSHQRAMQLAKEREIMKELFREEREKIRKDNKVSVSLNKFVQQADDRNVKLAKDTVGLVKLDQFTRIREGIEKGELPERSVDDLRNQKKRMTEAASKLSFALEEEEEEFMDLAPKKQRLGMDPTVTSYFGKDLAVEAAVADLEKKQAAEETAILEKLKSTPIRLTCSFYDGADHRFYVDCRKGDTVIEFLEKARLAYGPLRGLLLEDLMFIKENVILPSNWSFHDFIEREARSRNDHMLFNFVLVRKGDQTQEIEANGDGERMVETDQSRNAKICGRKWYQRNKHLIPAKLWTFFDPIKHLKSKEK